MTDEFIVRGQISQALTGALHRSNQGLKAVPELLYAAIEQRAWEKRIIVETGEVFDGFKSFDEWVCTAPPKGLGASTAIIDGFAKDNEPLRAKIDEARQRPRGNPTGANQYNSGIFDNIQHSTPAPTGTSADAALRRLRKDRPDLHERVLAGELTPHAAMKVAGFRRETITLPITDTMYEAARIVVKRLDALQYDRFFQHLVYLAVHEDDEDYGVVDANPTDNTNK